MTVINFPKDPLITMSKVNRITFDHRSPHWFPSDSETPEIARRIVEEFHGRFVGWSILTCDKLDKDGTPIGGTDDFVVFTLDNEETRQDISAREVNLRLSDYLVGLGTR